jgi:hypothetical protein
LNSTPIDSLTLTDAERQAIFGEGWFVTDLLGDIGSWLAAANSFLERIRSETYRREEIDKKGAVLEGEGTSGPLA